MKRHHILLLLGAMIAASVAGWFVWPSRNTLGEAPHEETVVLPPEPQDSIVKIEIVPEATFGTLMEEAGIPAGDAMEIYDASKETYDLANIRVGKTIDLISNPDGVLYKLVYAINTEEELHMLKEGEVWKAVREKIEYEVRMKQVKGRIDSSLYAAGLAEGLDEPTIIAIAGVFEWTIDFSQDVRVDDTFSFLYEELWRDGVYVRPGRVLAAEYVNDGTKFRGYLFTNAKGEEGHYDEAGESLRKMFLKAPVEFRYVSSGFTTGQRYVSAFNTSTGHRAIDYATSSGTPIRATADGTVVYSGWNGPYGNFVSIRHNATYTTNYAHQSKIAVKKGQQVTQGQVIGYVGSTGFSTGPHLHYEMVKNGEKINPLRETFPSTEPITPEELPEFQKVVEQYRDQL